MYKRVNGLGFDASTMNRTFACVPPRVKMGSGSRSDPYVCVDPCSAGSSYVRKDNKWVCMPKTLASNVALPGLQTPAYAPPASVTVVYPGPTPAPGGTVKPVPVVTTTPSVLVQAVKPTLTSLVSHLRPIPSSVSQTTPSSVSTQPYKKYGTTPFALCPEGWSKVKINYPSDYAEAIVWTHECVPPVVDEAANIDRLPSSQQPPPSATSTPAVPPTQTDVIVPDTGVPPSAFPSSGDQVILDSTKANLPTSTPKGLSTAGYVGVAFGLLLLMKVLKG